MAEIKFETVTRDYAKLDDIKRIYEEAFPVNERALEIEDFLSDEMKGKGVRVIGAVEEGRLIGFWVVIDNPKYIYGLFVAVDRSLRGGGYGTRIVKSLIDSNPDKVLLFDIETPREDAPNNEQRIRRETFYNRLGCFRAGVDFDYEGDNYVFLCSRQDDNIKDYINEYMEKCKALKQKMEGK